MRVRIGEFVAAFVWSRGGSPGCGRPLARSVFRVVVCWFSACCGVMPPRARWGGGCCTSGPRRRFRASASNRAGSPVTSHVIPVHIFQTLKCGRWNCNVCGLSRKMTALNCVRLLLGWLPSSLSGLTTAPATATWPAGALSIGTVKIRPLCNGLELGGGGLQHEELAAGVLAACRRSSRRFRVCSCDWVRTRSVGSAPLLIGCSATDRV